MNACFIIIIVSNIKCISNQCVKVNVANADNAGICQLTKFWKDRNTCTFVVPVFQPWFHSDTFWSF